MNTEPNSNAPRSAGLELMAAALRQADAGIREFLTLWLESQPPQDQARIEALIANGLTLGLHATAIGTPRYEVTLTDAAGARRTLATVQFRSAAH